MQRIKKSLELPSFWSSDSEIVEQKINTAINELKDNKTRNIVMASKEFAALRHGINGQKRADNTPFILHPYRVFLSAIYEFDITDPTILSVALLHDVLEDTDCTEKEISEEFGISVLETVRNLTRKQNEKRSPEGDSLDSAYYQRVKSNEKALIVKFIDKLDNIRDALNHPKHQKKVIYITECQTIFFHLLKELVDKKISDRIRSCFIRAMGNHTFFFLQQFLFNPFVEDFEISNGAVSCIVKANETSLEKFLESICSYFSYLIHTSQINDLIAVANLPLLFSGSHKKAHWYKIKAQLDIFTDLLAQLKNEIWIQDIINDKQSLLTIIHARFFLLANYQFNIWERSYGYQIFQHNKNLYKSIYFREDNKTEEWLFELEALIVNQHALRLAINNDGNIEALEWFQKYGQSRKVVASRIFSELLETATQFPMFFRSNESKPLLDKFTVLWNHYIDNNLPAYLNNLYHPELKDLSVGKKYTIVGFSEIIRLFPKYVSNCYSLLNILIRSHSGNSRFFIHFNVKEIEKRKNLFEKALSKVTELFKFSELSQAGIFIKKEFSTNRETVYSITPEYLYAFINRIPESTARQREIISKDGYSAESIFDEMLLKPCSDTNRLPLWVPRIYRILDTMADFNPKQVQKISIHFYADELKDEFVSWYPLSRSSKNDLISKRKELIARYVAIQIYNFGITIGCYNATLDISSVKDEFCQSAFTTKELTELVEKAAIRYGYEHVYRNFIETYNFKNFSIRPSLHGRKEIVFDKEDISYGTFLGIDIGGTDVKATLFKNGKCAHVEGREVIKFPTFPTHLPQSEKYLVTDFCERIITQIDKIFKSGVVSEFSWENVEGVGITWPGPVNNNQIVSTSKSLVRLKYPAIAHHSKNVDTINLTYDSTAKQIHSFDLSSYFRNEILEKYLKRASDDSKASFVATIENDGNSEAYGNYCLMLKKEKKMEENGGKLIIKLGTSVAGGHINKQNSISSQVTEFAKIILDFNKESTSPEIIVGSTRDYIPSLGVRNLSRSFIFNEKLLFGTIACNTCKKRINESDNDIYRIEAKEIGLLLEFYNSLLPEEERTNYQKHLIYHDNKCVKQDIDKYINLLLKGLKSSNDDITKYIAVIGRDQLKKESYTENSELAQWSEGVIRLSHLMSGKFECSRKFDLNRIPETFPYYDFAYFILGAVALFSQLSLQLSHLIVALYNIYKRDQFNGVILSGGVLSGLTGKLVLDQSHLFLEKYYDKVFGKDKHLNRESILAPKHDVDTDSIGPFGAAMVANRRHKKFAIAVMEKMIENAIGNLHSGEIFDSEKFYHSISKTIPRITKVDIISFLDHLVQQARIVPDLSGEGEGHYIKTVNVI